MYCRYCGKYLPDDSRFCNSCGKSVDSSSSSVRPISSPKLAYGTLFVRRNPSVRDAAIPADIYVDEAKSGYVNNGMDCQIRLPVGKHAVKVMIRNRYIGTRYVDIPSGGKVEIVFSADDVLRMEYGQHPISDSTPVATPKNMGTWKLVSGILSLALAMIVLFQSCAAGAVGTFDNDLAMAGVSGLFVGILMIAAGVVSIAARKSRGGNIAIIAISVVGMIIGFGMHGVYEDLIVWTCWLVVLAILALICFIRWKKA